MMDRSRRFFSPLLLGIVGIGILLSGCGREVICSTPYIVSNGACCVDWNDDDTCDREGEISREEGGAAASEDSAAVSDVTDQAHPGSTPSTGPSPVAGDTPQLSSEISSSDDAVLPLDEITLGRGPWSFVVYGDYEDQYTKRFFAEVIPVLDEHYPDALTVVFRHFAESYHRNSNDAAAAVYCASEQGKHLELFHELMTRNPLVSMVDIRIYSRTLGIDADRLSVCVDSRRYHDLLIAERNQGIAEGVNSPLTIFFAGRRIVGYRDASYFLGLLAQTVPLQSLPTPVKITASSLGKPFIIREGPNALQPSITASMFSNRIDLSRGNFALTAVDFGSEDQATLRATFEDTQFAAFTSDVYEITLDTLDSSRFGGVLTGRQFFGETGILSSELPAAKGFVSVWGRGSVKKNDKLLAEDVEVWFFIIEGLREQTKLQAQSAPGDFEAYLLLPGKHGKERQPLGFMPDGFIHILWEDLIYRQT